MAKKPQATPAAAPAAAAPKAPTVPHIASVAFTANPFAPNSARWHYYNAVQAHVGQPVSVYCAAILAAPPCYTKKGTVEPPQPFFNWFVSHGYATKVNQ